MAPTQATVALSTVADLIPVPSKRFGLSMCNLQAERLTDWFHFVDASRLHASHHPVWSSGCLLWTDSLASDRHFEGLNQVSFWRLLLSILIEECYNLGDDGVVSAHKAVDMPLRRVMGGFGLQFKVAVFHFTLFTGS